jgi:NAD(P)-dependent dehydrogenase (short-subunit alcohol dehydrogenase family)
MVPRYLNRDVSAPTLRSGGTRAKVAVGDLDADLANQAAAEILGDLVALPLDVTSPQSFATFLDDAERVLGPLDILVNNAGVMLTGEFLAESRAAEDKMVDINLHGVILGCKLAAERFIQRCGGSVINIASMGGVGGFPGVATYCATKFGVVGLTYARARNYARTTSISV